MSSKLTYYFLKRGSSLFRGERGVGGGTERTNKRFRGLHLFLNKDREMTKLYGKQVRYKVKQDLLGLTSGTSNINATSSAKNKQK